MIALLSPGQGAQSPGMLAAWLELPGAAELLDAYGEAAGLDLRGYGTVADADTIRDTAVAQPLLVATSLLSLRLLLADADPLDAAGTVVAGHSVGEFAAAAAAGVLSDTDAMTLVAARGRAMAGAAALAPTGMSAVLGGDAEEVAAAIAAHHLVAANANGGGQVVAAGTLDDLAALAADPPARARVVPLPVAGAFHTEHMRPAVTELAAAAAGVPAGDPGPTLLSNADGAAVASGVEVLTRLVAQVTLPVRWDLCQQTMARLGTVAAVELAPAGVLTGLARRTLPGVATVPLKSPDDLDAARALLREHTTPSSTEEPQE